MEKTTRANQSYEQSIHRIGRIWMSLALLVILAVPLAISVNFQTWPALGSLMGGLLPIMMIYVPIGIIEVITFSPMLGSGATYLAFTTGNLTNLKVPCALNAMEIAEIEPGSDEGEVISTIAVAASSLVTNLVLVIGVLMFVQLAPILSSPVLQPAFENILPALFGALGYLYISKNWKLAVVPVSLMVVIFMIAPTAPVGILIPVSALSAIAAARFMYNRKMI
ncbi:MAG: hypothetical protein ACNA7Z_04535 [Dethiobacteria bacterium]|nr:hypothetical protein [Bacillota bacterium]MDW7729645.1 hypothetical protein [Bacillota bacterium]